MENIYSKINTSNLLAVIHRQNDISNKRTDLSPPEEFLQSSSKRLSKGTSFKPHKHNKLIRETTITQEAWVFLSGKVKAYFYDIDDTLLHETELCGGDCAIVFRAGHGFEVLEDNTILYEFKTGPYYGVEADKKFIK